MEGPVLSEGDMGRAARLLLLGGMTLHEIAARLDTTVKTLYRWLARAREEDRPRPSPGSLPRPEPWFPAGHFVPLMTCPCELVGPPPLPFVCLACHRSLFDAMLPPVKPSTLELVAKARAFRAHCKSRYRAAAILRA